MPLPHIEMIFCDCCGKLIKVVQHGDAITPEEWTKFNQERNKKKTCWKYKILRKK